MLQMFLQPIVKFTMKRAAISQCLVWAARPKLVILPLLFGLSVELDHIFGSKWFINELFHLGYSISYDEVTRFKQNSIISSNFEDILPKYSDSDSVSQWLSDSGRQCRPKHMYPQKQVYPLKSLNSLSSYSSCTCFPFPLAVTYFGILLKRCILEINSKVAGLASFKMYPSEHTCLLLI